MRKWWLEEEKDITPTLSELDEEENFYKLCCCNCTYEGENCYPFQGNCDDFKQKED